MTINQITSLVKTPKAVWKDRVSITMKAVRPGKAQAPTGNGLRTKPKMVDRKMASNCQACGVTSTGLGTKKPTAMPTAMEMMKAMGFAP
ncbi:hypothetical protein ACFX2J_014853 [Malus domestica]